MPSYSRLTCTDARALLLSRGEEAVTIVDIRDPDSYAAGHISGAQHLDSAGMARFIETADPDAAVIVCCFHGHMSQSAGAFLAEKDFDEVYSLDGGFTEWASQFPDAVSRDTD